MITVFVYSCAPWANPGEEGTGEKTAASSAGVPVGTAAAGVVDFKFARAMQESDRLQVVNAYEYNPDHHTSKWINEETGNQFFITPRRSYHDDSSGLNCREAEIISIVDGKSEKETATACRQAGRWYFQYGTIPPLHRVDGSEPSP